MNFMNYFFSSFQSFGVFLNCRKINFQINIIEILFDQFDPENNIYIIFLLY